MPNVLVIYNPVAGLKKINNPKNIIKNVLKERGDSFDFFETMAVKKQPFEQFLGKHYQKIIVAGGDGTVAEVISFLIRNKIKTPLVILPQGSGNILALSIGVSLNLRNALERGLAGDGKLLDVMQVNTRYHGLIAVGFGYDTFVMERTTRSLKRKIGFLAYMWTIIKTILVYRGRDYKLSIDGRRAMVSAKTIMCFNAVPFGHLKVTELLGNPISPHDGILNVFAFNPRPIRDFLKFKKALKVFQGKKISIQAKKATRFQIDGNVFKGNSVTIELLPKAISIVH